MAISQIDVLLTLMFHIDDSPKDLKKIVTKLAKKQTNKGKIRMHPNGVVQRVINAKNMRAEIWNCMNDLDTINETIREFAESGHHGIVEFENILFPVKLQQYFSEEGRPVEETYIQQEDLDWAIENEGQIQISIAHAFKNMFNQTYITCDVVLFSEYGFSGKRETVTAMNMKNTYGSKQIGDTQYFK